MQQVMKGKENHHQTNITVITDSGKMDAKISRLKCDEKQEIYIVSKYFLTMQSLNMKRKIFTLEKPSQHQFNQVIKVNITSSKTYCHHTYSWYDTMRRIQYHFCGIPVKMHNNLNPIMRRYQTNTYKWKVQKLETNSSKVSRSREKKWRNCHRSNQIKKTLQLNATVGS